MVNYRLTITNSPIVFLGFSLRNFSYNFVSNVDIYNVGEGEEERTQKQIAECLATYSQVGLPMRQLVVTNF